MLLSLQQQQQLLLQRFIIHKTGFWSLNLTVLQLLKEDEGHSGDSVKKIHTATTSTTHTSLY